MEVTKKSNGLFVKLLKLKILKNTFAEFALLLLLLHY